MPMIGLPNFAEKLLAEFSARDTTRVDTPIIQPAEPFLDMAGCSITLTMLDDEIARLWDAPVHTAALRWGM